jgi:serine/threonine protein kinase
MDSPIILDLYDFQTRNRSWRNARFGALRDSLFLRAYAVWGSRWAYFLKSATDLDDETDWRPIRPLGKGGYGLVGLWQKFNKEGAVIDSLAIKQQKYKRNQAIFEVDGSDGNHLAIEAVLMSRLNALKCENIIQLRGFRNNSFERLWRFYFEFAQWGDLRTLINNYRAWDTYLPEEFLWSIFHGLANAAYELRKGPDGYRDLLTGKKYEEGEAFVVHFDLKPDNIFLADPTDPAEEPQFSNYPIVKMADFGLSQLSHPADELNPIYYRTFGTEGYRSPVRYLGGILWWSRANYASGARMSDGPLATPTRRQAV